MKYLRAAYDFIVKNWIILVPIFVATFIPALLIKAVSWNIKEVFDEYTQNIDYYTANEEALRALISSVRTGTRAGGMFSTILNLAAYPMTAGLIKLGLAGETITYNDFTTSLSENIVKYLKMIFAAILLGIAVGLISLVYSIFAVMVSAGGDSMNFTLLIVLALILVIALMVGAFFLTFWFAAMVIDDLTVMNALKKSISLVKRCFWTVFGITILIQLVTLILSMIAAGFSGIPIIGALLSSVVSTGSTVLTMAFTFILYQSLTRQENVIDNDGTVIY